MQHDIGGDHEFVALMIAGTVHKQQDEVPGGIFAQGCPEKIVEAFRIGRRHDQI